MTPGAFFSCGWPLIFAYKASSFLHVFNKSKVAVLSLFRYAGYDHPNRVYGDPDLWGGILINA